MIEKMDSLKRTMLELLIGIAAYGILFEGVGILLVKDKGSYSVGLLCGTVIAVILMLHMAYSLNDALDWEEKYAKAKVRSAAVLRYFGVAAVMILLAYFRIGNILSCFLGIMTLKAAAYTQPFVHKIINNIFHIEEGGCENAIIDEDDEFDPGEWAERRLHDQGPD